MAVLADEYGPFNAGPGASVGEAQWGRIYESLSSSGASPQVLSELRVTQRAAGANMSVDVASGQAFLHGHQGRWASVSNLPITANPSGSTRYDRVIARSDRTANTVVLDVLPGSGGVLAALTQNDTIWESHIAQVTVAVGASTITNASIVWQPTWAAGRTTAPVALANMDFTQLVAGQPWAELPSGNQTVYNMTTPLIDTGGFWSSGAPSRFTIQRDGAYFVAAQCLIDEGRYVIPSGVSNANIGKGYRAISILQGGGTSIQTPQQWWWGTTPVAGTTAPYNVPPNSRIIGCSGIMRLAATEYIQVGFFQSSGSNMGMQNFLLGVVYLGVP